MNINWFSPLAPDRSGIAEFSAGVVPALRSRANIRFITQSLREGTGTRTVEAESTDSITLADMNAADLNVFNIGNNVSYHDEIWRMSCECPGVVILHDFRLQHLFGGIFLMKRRDVEGYVRLMREIYGIEGEAAANLMAAGRLSPETVSEAFPLVEAALEGAVGAVVHSENALRLVRERTRVPIIKLDLPYHAFDAIRPGSPAGSRRGREINIVAFGHIGPNRRIESALRALATVGATPPVRLHLIGDLWNERLLREQARDYGVTDRVTFHGHLPDASLDQHLRHADLVFNLRWPTMGEASYSQLRAWLHAAPTVVTRTGWYSELPADAVIHVSPQSEVADVVRVIERMQHDPNAFLSIGEGGRRLLEQHHKPQDYVDKLLAFGASLEGATVTAERRLASKIGREIARFPRPAGDLMLESTDQVLRRTSH